MKEFSERIVVALSGGGYRAAAFSAGVLLYLIDSGKRNRISAISSVSGGSITNAYFARHILDAASPVGDPWMRASYLFAYLARRDIISPFRMLTIASIAGMSAGILAGLASVWFDATASSAVLTAIIVALAVLAVCFGFLFFQLRTSLEFAIEWLLRLPIINPADRSSAGEYLSAGVRFIGLILTFRIRSAIQSIRPRLTKLSELKADYIPVFCCTDLATGSHFYLSSAFIAGVVPGPEGEWDSLNLCGSAPDLPIATAVAASAAYPVVFRPAVVGVDSLGLPARRGIVEDHIALADGGLHDNFGVSIVSAWLRGELSKPVLDDLGQAPSTLLVVDSGQPAYQSQRKQRSVSAALRSVEVIHQANGLARRREIKHMLRGGALEGSIISISDDPYAIAEGCDNQEARQTALSFLERTKAAHGLSRSGWRAISQQHNPSIPTNLRGLGEDTVVRLVIHGYLATMAHTVTELGWDPPPAGRICTDIPGLCTDRHVGSFWNRLAWVLSGKASSSQSSWP